MKLSGWGKYPLINASANAPRNIDDILSLVKQGDTIARGNGRAYGDSAISIKNTIHMKHFNHLLEFDSSTGNLIIESGVLLVDIIETFMPRGWFPFVTPGSKFVTVGGMIAADVHGKNHHKEGSFGNYVEWIDIITCDGTIKRCSNSENKDLFQWTIGGMGLTGIILRASIRLRPIESAWISQKTLVAKDIFQAMKLFEESNDATYSVAWIDCLQRGKTLGRSIVMLGDHAEKISLPLKFRKQPLLTPVKKKLVIPFYFPSWALNRLSVKIFNNLYYWNEKRKPKRQLVDWDTFFYPLDRMLGWNKIYGRKGFAQFQCVIPLKHAEQGIISLLEEIAKFDAGSFLAVLKKFGAQNSMFSFPMEGYTLALDFPINVKTLTLMKELDKITIRNKGRFYLAKDSRMSSDVFFQSESRADAFKNFRQNQGADKIYNSAQSKRLFL